MSPILSITTLTDTDSDDDNDLYDAYALYLIWFNRTIK